MVKVTINFFFIKNINKHAKRKLDLMEEIRLRTNQSLKIQNDFFKNPM
jgi:hypothetical protein